MKRCEPKVHVTIVDGPYEGCELYFYADNVPAFVNICNESLYVLGGNEHGSWVGVMASQREGKRLIQDGP